MAILNKQFEEFLSNINPDEKAVQYAIDAHEPVRECLEKVDDFKQYIEGSFLYGSYKRHTAVGDIKDVDIVVLTNFDLEDEKNTPQSVLRKLKAALARCYDDPENPQYQRRSIRIDEPLPDEEDVEMTLDIIPAVVVTDKESPLKVPDRIVKEWIWSHPKGHLKYTSDLNSQENSKGRFVPLVKIMKSWWSYQCEVRQPDAERPQPKGFWVEILTGENFDNEQTALADHFIAVLENVSSKYTEAEEVPELKDPSIENETVKSSMTMDEFEVFIEAINESLEQAILARDATDKLKSSELWREIFGETFPLYDEEETLETKAESVKAPLGSTSHAKPLPWPEKLDKKHRVRIDAYIYKDRMKLGGINSNGRRVRSGLQVKYVATTRAQGDYEVYWQVVNTGQQAAQENCLRGDYFKAKFLNNQPSVSPLVNWEMTSYTGKHWIECFIVKDDVCVGRSGKFFLHIKNPDF